MTHINTRTPRYDDIIFKTNLERHKIINQEGTTYLTSQLIKKVADQVLRQRPEDTHLM